MKKAMKILIVFLVFLCCGCADDRQKPSTPDDSIPNESVNRQYSVPTDLDPSTERSEPIFLYEKLELPEAISQADNLYCCYGDGEYTVLSLGSRNGKQEGPLQKTDSLALCDQDGGVAFFPVATEADIISALPYHNGIIYVDYEEQPDYVIWSVVQTDGEQDKVIDSGTSSYYEQIPYLFFVEGDVYYLCRNDGGFCVKAIKDGAVEVLFERDDCALSLVRAYSNGNQFCFLGYYPESNFATLFICDSSGVLFENELHGKITSYAIMGQYAVCGTGDEESGNCSVEVFNLKTGQGKMISEPVGPLYCLQGSGSECVCVGFAWQPYYVSISDERVSAMPWPWPTEQKSSTLTNILFYPAGESRFFVLARKGEEYLFYRLSITQE